MFENYVNRVKPLNPSLSLIMGFFCESDEEFP